MIKLLLRLAFFLVVGILVYNYFFGTPEEKETSKTIFREAKDLGKASWALLKTEKAKLDEGKYDTAIEKIGGLINQLEDRARSGKDREALDRLVELDQQRRELEGRLNELNDLKSRAVTPAEKRSVTQEESQLKTDLRRLFDETESLMQDMEQQ